VEYLIVMRHHREHIRIQKSFQVRYRLPWSSRWEQASTRDISAGGISFTVPRGFFFSGLPVEIEVDFPIASFRTRGRVARQRRSAAGREVGVSFGGLKAEIRESLSRYAYLCARSA